MMITINQWSAYLIGRFVRPVLVPLPSHGDFHLLRRPFRVVMLLKATLLLSIIFAAPVNATISNVFSKVDFQQRLGAHIPTAEKFVDAHGRTVTLKRYFSERPVILVLDYYNCPNLCGVTLSGLVEAAKAIDLTPGVDYDIVSVSIDPTETPTDAFNKKREYLRKYGHPDRASGWHFLTGAQPAIHKLAERVGFRYRYDPELRQYAHAAGIMIATPDGTISRYFYGVRFSPRDVRLGLVEASEGKTGTPVDQFLLLCYCYNPATGKYGFAISNTMRALALLTVGGIGLFIWRLSRDRKGHRA